MVKQIAKDIDSLSTERLADVVSETWKVLESGGVIISQLDVSYGFMGITPEAIGKINELKRRGKDKVTSVFGTTSLILRLLKCSKRQMYLAEMLEDIQYPFAFMGKINNDDNLIRALPQQMFQYLALDNSLTVFSNLGRVSRHLPLIAEAHGKLILGSSANITGTGNIYESERLPRHFIESCDLIIGNGKSKYADLKLKTVIINLFNNTIVRTGPFHQEIQSMLDHAQKARIL
jgi:tRNA A37 threonylcarbamoyladenosine synthetase subunit TsaC/SUA5/YrdC